MKTKVFLIADAWGVVRLTKREPALNRGEVAVRLTVTIPDAVFKNPIVDASVEVAEDRVIAPSVEVEA